MQPDDRTPVPFERGDFAQPLAESRHIFAVTQGVKQKTRQQHDDAEREQDAVEKIHSSGFKVQSSRFKVDER
jgi:hypothetical protein